MTDHMEQTFTVPPAADGRKLKTFLQKNAQMSASFRKHLKWNGEILRNGEPLRNANALLSAGDVITCRWNEKTPIIPAVIPLTVIYEDKYLLAVGKPAGMLIHPTGYETRQTLVNAVAGYYRKTGQNAGIHPVYRIDRDTTGLVLIAKTAQGQYLLTRSHDCIYREYLALVSGRLTPETGLIEAPIGRDPAGHSRFYVTPDGKTAQTEYTTIRTYPDYSLVRFHLLTGRTHQIRVHCAHLDHPLLGDTLYGGNTDKISRQALHARSLRCQHPVTGEILTLTAPVPDDMQRLIDVSDGSI